MVVLAGARLQAPTAQGVESGENRNVSTQGIESSRACSKVFDLVSSEKEGWLGTGEPVHWWPMRKELSSFDVGIEPMDKTISTVSLLPIAPVVMRNVKVESDEAEETSESGVELRCPARKPTNRCDMPWNLLA